MSLKHVQYILLTRIEVEQDYSTNVGQNLPYWRYDTSYRCNPWCFEATRNDAEMTK